MSGTNSETLSENEAAAPAGTLLPEDFPGRRILVEAGITTMEAVRAEEDPSRINGIGPVTAAQIRERLGEKALPPSIKLVGKNQDIYACANDGCKQAYRGRAYLERTQAGCNQCRTAAKERNE